MIRDATVNDLDDMLRLCRKAHQESPYKGIPCDEDYIRRTALVAICMPAFCVFVAEEEDEVVGMMVGAVKPNAFGMMTASDVIVYVEKPGPGVRLFERFLEWTEKMPAQLTTVTSSFGNEKFDRYLEGIGMRRIGGLFIGTES